MSAVENTVGTCLLKIMLYYSPCNLVFGLGAQRADMECFFTLECYSESFGWPSLVAVLLICVQIAQLVRSLWLSTGGS